MSTMRMFGLYLLVSVNSATFSFVTGQTTNTRLFKRKESKHEFLWESIGSVKSVSSLHCVSRCTFTDECVSVYYTSNSSECFLLKPQLACSTRWTLPDHTEMFRAVGVTQLTVDVFRASSGTGVAVYDPWVSDTYQSPCTPAVYDMTQKIDFTFKHPLVNNWSVLNIQEVIVTLWKKGRDVVRLVFDGRDSTITNWFSHPRLLESSFPDLLHFNTGVVSLPGWNGTRRFYVMHSHADCPYDKGWMCLKEEDGGCDWDTLPAYPAFIYSTSGHVAQWQQEEIGHADDLVVSVVMEV